MFYSLIYLISIWAEWWDKVALTLILAESVKIINPQYMIRMILMGDIDRKTKTTIAIHNHAIHVKVNN